MKVSLQALIEEVTTVMCRSEFPLKARLWSCVALAMLMGLVAPGAAGQQLNAKQILEELNRRVAATKSESRVITDDYTLVTRMAGLPDTTITGETIYHQKGNKLRSHMVRATVKVPAFRDQPAVSYEPSLREEWTFDGDRGEFRYLKEPNPQYTPHGVAKTEAFKVSTKTFPADFHNPSVNGIPKAMIDADWHARQEIHMGHPFYVVWTPQARSCATRVIHLAQNVD
jgi:hypothetical protein